MLTHTQYARSLNLDPRILESVIEDGRIFAIEKKHAATYHLEDPLPSREEILTAARALYEQRLRTALRAVRRLEIEIEAIRNDLTEALDHGLDPVLPLGNDVLVAGGPNNPRSPLDSARGDLSFALMGVELAHRGLHDHDLQARLNADSRSEVNGS